MGHLLAVGLLALAAPSGPWLTNFGPSEAVGPQFASSISHHFSIPYYLQPLRMTHNYHFKSNQVANNAIYFEATLKDEHGNVVKTLTFPDPKANFWVRHRQDLLAQGLGNDQPVQPRGSEFIAPNKDKTEEIEFWDVPEPNTLRLKKDEKGKIPNDRMQPAPWAKLLAQSYMRYLCQEHDVSSVELTRRHKDVIMPAILFFPDPPTAEMFPVWKSHFGEFRREK